MKKKILALLLALALLLGALPAAAFAEGPEGDAPGIAQPPAPEEIASPAPERTPEPKETASPAPEGSPMPEGTPAPAESEAPEPEGTPLPAGIQTSAPEGTPLSAGTQTSAPEGSPLPEGTPLPAASETPEPEGAPLPTIAPALAQAEAPALYAPPATQAAEGETVEIGTAEELAAFRDCVNAGKTTLNAVLTADIDLGGVEWTPIFPSSGYVTDAYAGTFDGAGHTIRGLYINSDKPNQGLFGMINGATIQNLRVEGSVTSSGSYVGGIVGKVQQGTVVNCSFSGSVSTTKSGGYAGGIAGYAGNTASQLAAISGCLNAASVNGDTRGTAGGIVGYAKYTAIENCYNTGAVNGASRAGGIAGQLQNNCTASGCYNLGGISGSKTAADICDFVYASSGLSNCWYKTKSKGGDTGSVDGGGDITTANPDVLLAALGSAFAADTAGINNGWPVLAWQAGTPPAPRDPKIIIEGSAVLCDTNAGPKPQTTLTVRYQDMEDTPAVVWSLSGGEADPVARLETPDDAGPNNARVVLHALAPGKTTLTAAAGEYTAALEVIVYPFVTTVELEGTPAAGETVRAQVNVLGGGSYDESVFPPLTVQWKYLTGEQYKNGQTGTNNYTLIPGAQGMEFAIPENFAGNYLSFSIRYNGEDKTPGRPVQVISRTQAALNAQANALVLPKTEFMEDAPLSLPAADGQGAAIAWASSDPALADPASGRVTLPAEGDQRTVRLTATLTRDGLTATRCFYLTIWSRKEAEAYQKDLACRLQTDLDAALGSYYRLVPVFGRDTNAAEMLETALNEKLAAKLEGEPVRVSVRRVEEVYGGAGIAPDGGLTYFYADPNAAPAIRVGSYRVTFAIAWRGARVEKTLPVLLYWDAEKVRQAMRQQLASLTLEELLAGQDAGAVTANLTLPQVVDGKRWALVSWQSSDPDVVSISSERQATADTLFDPYVGVVHPGTVAQTVTLTATFTFQYTNDVTGMEEPITLSKVFDLTVAPLSAGQLAQRQQQLRQCLQTGFENAGIRDAAGSSLEFTQNEKGDITIISPVTGDLLLPTTRDFGVDGKVTPVYITSSDPRFAELPGGNNIARAVIYRPMPGEEPAAVTLTVSLGSRAANASAGLGVTRTITFTVQPLTQDEIDREAALLDAAAAAYQNGTALLGANAYADDVTADLAPFFEVRFGPDGQTLEYARTAAECTGQGIAPVPMEGWERMESWRLFCSSNPGAVGHENLLVTRQFEGKEVTVTSWLASETLARYGERYAADPEGYAAYAAQEGLIGLCRREVSTAFVVRGQNPARMVLKAGRRVSIAYAQHPAVTFSFDGRTESLTMREGQTVFDAFETLFGREYAYTARGGYISAITGPDGVTRAEKGEGPNSGWVYRVNGVLVGQYMNHQVLKNGDVIELYYTADWTREPGAVGWQAPAQGGVPGPAQGLPSAGKAPPADLALTETGAGEALQADLSLTETGAGEALRAAMERRAAAAQREDPEGRPSPAAQQPQAGQPLPDAQTSLAPGAAQPTPAGTEQAPAEQGSPAAWLLLLPAGAALAFLALVKKRRGGKTH